MSRTTDTSTAPARNQRRSQLLPVSMRTTWTESNSARRSLASESVRWSSPTIRTTTTVHSSPVSSAATPIPASFSCGIRSVEADSSEAGVMRPAECSPRRLILITSVRQFRSGLRPGWRPYVYPWGLPLEPPGCTRLLPGPDPEPLAW